MRTNGAEDVCTSGSERTTASTVGRPLRTGAAGPGAHVGPVRRARRPTRPATSQGAARPPADQAGPGRPHHRARRGVVAGRAAPTGRRHPAEPYLPPAPGTGARGRPRPVGGPPLPGPRVRPRSASGAGGRPPVRATLLRRTPFPRPPGSRCRPRPAHPGARTVARLPVCGVCHSPATRRREHPAGTGPAHRTGDLRGGRSRPGQDRGGGHGTGTRGASTPLPGAPGGPSDDRAVPVGPSGRGAGGVRMDPQLSGRGVRRGHDGRTPATAHRSAPSGTR